MKTSNPLLLSIFSGILLALSWPSIGDFTILIFFAFIPLLLLESNRFQKNNFGFILISFITFNAFTAYWISYASLGGGICIVLVNGTLMALIFHLFTIVKRSLGSRLGYFSLIVIWLGFEYFHANWDLTLSWLNLGHVFSSKIKWIQWYEYVGVGGGTFWVLLVNIAGFRVLKSYIQYKRKKDLLYGLIGISILIVCPILISHNIFNNYIEKGEDATFVVVQPNYEVYSQKFAIPPIVQLQEMKQLAVEKLDSNVSFVLLPETAIPQGIWINELEESPSIDILKSLTIDFPKLSVITGASLYQRYDAKEKPTVTARSFQYGYYDSYNSAINITKQNEIEIYHKSKLVPGVEKMPFPKVLGFLEKIALDLGGAVGSLGIQTERENFNSKQVSVAPVICYESIYGEHVSDYVKKGANIIGIITNDGWWGDTPGYRQHWQYAKLRAIENRRSIARSANTGISGFINQRGEELQKSRWDEKNTLKQTLKLNNELTFYSKYDDYLYRVASFIAVILLVFSFVKSIKSKLLKV